MKIFPTATKTYCMIRWSVSISAELKIFFSLSFYDIRPKIHDTCKSHVSPDLEVCFVRKKFKNFGTQNLQVKQWDNLVFFPIEIVGSFQTYLNQDNELCQKARKMKTNSIVIFSSQKI